MSDDDRDFSCSIKIYAKPRPRAATPSDRIWRAADAIALDWRREAQFRAPRGQPPTTRDGIIRVSLLGAMRRVVW